MQLSLFQINTYLLAKAPLCSWFGQPNWVHTPGAGPIMVLGSDQAFCLWLSYLLQTVHVQSIMLFHKNEQNTNSYKMWFIGRSSFYWPQAWPTRHWELILCSNVTALYWGGTSQIQWLLDIRFQWTFIFSYAAGFVTYLVSYERHGPCVYAGKSEVHSLMYCSLQLFISSHML